MYPSLDFWSENMPSGNPVSQVSKKISSSPRERKLLQSLDIPMKSSGTEGSSFALSNQLNSFSNLSFIFLEYVQNKQQPAGGTRTHDNITYLLTSMYMSTTLLNFNVFGSMLVSKNALLRLHL
jgi:hypothetical protein